MCDLEACARPLAVDVCTAPECPAFGDLTLLERPLRAHGPWPTGEEAWNRLMDELHRVPVLASLFPGGKAPRFPRPRLPPRPPLGWIARPFVKLTLDVSVAAEEGRFVRDGAPLGGAALRVGGRWAPYPSNDTTWEGLIRQTVVGDAWGLDLRLRALEELHAIGVPRTWVCAGVSIAADNALGDSNATSL